MKPECSDISGLFMDCLYDEASGDDRRKLEEHLDKCIECREEWLSLTSTRKIFSGLEEELPKRDNAYILQAAKRESGKRKPVETGQKLLDFVRTFFARPGIMVPVASLALVMVLGITLGDEILRLRESSSPVEAAAIVSSDESGEILPFLEPADGFLEESPEKEIDIVQDEAVLPESEKLSEIDDLSAFVKEDMPVSATEIKAAERIERAAEEPEKSGIADPPASGTGKALEKGARAAEDPGRVESAVPEIRKETKPAVPRFSRRVFRESDSVGTGGIGSRGRGGPATPEIRKQMDVQADTDEESSAIRKRAAVRRRSSRTVDMPEGASDIPPSQAESESAAPMPSPRPSPPARTMPEEGYSEPALAEEPHSFESWPDSKARSEPEPPLPLPPSPAPARDIREPSEKPSSPPPADIPEEDTLHQEQILHSEKELSPDGEPGMPEENLDYYRELVSGGKCQEALPGLMRFAEMEAEKAQEVNVLLARCLELTGRKEEAADAWRRVLDISSSGLWADEAGQALSVE